MSPEKQKIAIAKICGWAVKEDADGFWRAVEPIHGMRPEKWMSENNVWSTGIPDYIDDLNAMHEAESIMDIDELSDYADLLGKNDPIYGHNACVADAKDRAKAFLKIFDAWVD